MHLAMGFEAIVQAWVVFDNQVAFDNQVLQVQAMASEAVCVVGGSLEAFALDTMA